MVAMRPKRKSRPTMPQLWGVETVPFSTSRWRTSSLECALRTEVLAVLGDQHEAGVGAVVDALCQSVTDPVSEIMAQSLVHVEEKTVVDGVPPRGGFKIKGEGEVTNARIKRT